MVYTIFFKMPLKDKMLLQDVAAREGYTDVNEFSKALLYKAMGSNGPGVPATVSVLGRREHRLLVIMEDRPQGLTISELAKLDGIHINNCNTYMKGLRTNGIVEQCGHRRTQGRGAALYKLSLGGMELLARDRNAQRLRDIENQKRIDTLNRRTDPKSAALQRKWSETMAAMEPSMVGTPMGNALVALAVYGKGTKEEKEAEFDSMFQAVELGETTWEDEARRLMKGTT